LCQCLVNSANVMLVTAYCPMFFICTKLPSYQKARVEPTFVTYLTVYKFILRNPVIMFQHNHSPPSPPTFKFHLTLYDDSVDETCRRRIVLASAFSHWLSVRGPETVTGCALDQTGRSDEEKTRTSFPDFEFQSCGLALLTCTAGVGEIRHARFSPAFSDVHIRRFRFNINRLSRMFYFHVLTVTIGR
jgi:hypothetical protein